MAPLAAESWYSIPYCPEGRLSTKLTASIVLIGGRPHFVFWNLKPQLRLLKISSSSLPPFLCVASPGNACTLSTRSAVLAVPAPSPFWDAAYSWILMCYTTVIILVPITSRTEAKKWSGSFLPLRSFNISWYVLSALSFSAANGVVMSRPPIFRWIFSGAFFQC